MPLEPFSRLTFQTLDGKLTPIGERWLAALGILGSSSEDIAKLLAGDAPADYDGRLANLEALVLLSLIRSEPYHGIAELQDLQRVTAFPQSSAVDREADSFVAGLTALPQGLERAEDAHRLLAGIGTAASVSPQFFQDTNANRASLYPAAAFPYGSRFFETDRLLTYINVAGTWTYSTGIYRNTLANLPTLATADAGLLYWVTDYSHLLLWSGSAWGWAPGDGGSGYYQLFEASPSGYGANAWALCDGSTVARLNADGTTSNITLDNVGTAAYLKGGTSSAAPAAASGTTANQTATNVAAATGISVADHSTAADTDVTGAGTRVTTANHVVTDPTHNHTQNAHNHGPGSLELLNLQKKLYYRR